MTSDIYLSSCAHGGGISVSNAPTLYGVLSCFTNTSPWDVLATPVSIVSGTNSDCETDGAHPGYACALEPGTWCCYQGYRGSECFYSVYWQIDYGRGGTNAPPPTGPPTYSPTNSAPGGGGQTTNGNNGSVLPPGVGNPFPNPVPGPANGGSGNNTNVTGNQYYNGVTYVGNMIWSGDQLLAGKLEQIHSDLTNGIGGTGGTGTNALGTYATNTPTPVDYSQGTNLSAASNAFRSVFGSTIGSLEGVENGASNVVNQGSVPAGSAPPSITVFGTTINWNPDTMLGTSGLGDAIKSVVGWAATVWFLIWFGKRYVEAVQTMGLVQLGGVPDLSVTLAGFGGNIVTGVAAALIVPFVFCFVWVFAFTVLISKFTGLSGGTYWATNIFTVIGGVSMGAAQVGQWALWFANLVLPVAYLMSLLTTVVMARFAMAKIVLICVGVSRFLFGK